MAARVFNLSANNSAKAKGGWNRNTLKLSADDLTAILVAPVERTSKDGSCFVAGTVISSDRKAEAVKSIDLLVYDIDGSQTVEDVLRILDESNLYYWLYTTYSHKSTKTSIKTDNYEKWAISRSRNLEPTEKDIVDYLEDKKKGHLTSISFDPLDVTHTENGMEYVVEHAPVDKFRVVLPLHETLVLSSLGATTKRAIEAWKGIYHGVGQSLGLTYDSTCEDPSRLYYLPAHAPNKLHNYKVFQGGEKFIRVLDYPRALTNTDKKNSARKPFNEGLVTDKNGVPIQLQMWAAQNTDFDIEGCLESCLPSEMLKTPRNKGGFHVQCPFEDGHSTTGSLGTFVANCDETYESWVIDCRHDSCHSRNKVEFLGAFIQEGYIKAEDLGIEPVVASPKMTNTQLSALLGIDQSTLPSSSSKIADTVAVQEYEDREAAGDEALSKDEVYESALVEIQSATKAIEAAKALGRIVAKKCDVDTADILEVLAKSPLTGESINAVLLRLSRNMMLDYSASKRSVTRHRLDMSSVDEKLAEVQEDRAIGHDLDLKLRTLADYYLMEPRELAGLYNRRELQLVKDRHGKMFADKFPQMTRRWSKLRQGNRMVYLDMPASIRKGDAVTQRPGDLEHWMRNENKSDVVTIGKTTKEVKTFLYKAWSEECTEIEEYSGLTFLPGEAQKTEDNKFNLWAGAFFVPRIPGDCSLIENHIKDVWCSGDELVYNWVISWLASIFQRPQFKPPTAIALLGAQGTGKSIIFEHGIARILGPYFGTSADRDDIVGRWSGHLVGKLLWVAEESLFAGDKRAMNKLKSRISSNTVDVEYKGLDKFAIPSFTRFVFTSNQTHALNLESDDRRFCVLPTSNLYQQNTVYFTRMKEWFDWDGVSHLYDFLLNWKPEDKGLTWNSLMHPPFNEAKRQQAEMSLEPSEIFFLDLLKTGRVELPPDVNLEGNELVSWSLEEELSLPVRQLKTLFDLYLKAYVGSNARFERNKFSALVSKYLSTDPNGVGSRKAGHLTRIFPLPRRKEVLKGAVIRRLLTQQEVDIALESVNSHVNSKRSSDVF